MNTQQHYVINETGISEIAEFLLNNHKNGEMISTSSSCLIAWAALAEDSLEADGSAMIEIRSHDSVCGRTLTFTISPDGFHTETDQ